MRHRFRAGLLGAIAALAGCTSARPPAPPATMPDGSVRYADSRLESRIGCGAAPVILAGDRNVLTLQGPCRKVTVAGNRNDVTVNVAPGGLIEITGEHNDVTWHQVGEGPRPTLRITGTSNTFHPG